MAQYDDFANPSSSANAGIPYVVVVQSDLLDALPTRLPILITCLKSRFHSPLADQPAFKALACRGTAACAVARASR